MDDDKLRLLTEEATSLATSTKEKEFYLAAYKLFRDGVERHIDGLVSLGTNSSTSAGKTRLIVKPSPQLKAFHRAVLDLLTASGAFSSCKFAIGCVRKRGRKSLVSDNYRIAAANYLPPGSQDIVMIKMDIRNAFPSIASYRVKQAFQNFLENFLGSYTADLDGSPHRMNLQYTGRSKSHARIRLWNYLSHFLDDLVEICTYKNRLAVGLPLSPALFDLCLERVDARIDRALQALTNQNKEVCQKVFTHSTPNFYKGRYYRYIDDMVIFTHRVNKDIVKITHRILQSEGLQLHPNKTKIVPYSSGWCALGLSLSNPAGRPSKKFMKKARGLWHRWKVRKDKKAYEILKGMIASAEPYPFYRGRVAAQLGLRIRRKLSGKPKFSKGEWDLVPLTSDK